MAEFIDFTFIMSSKLLTLNEHYITPTLIAKLISNYIQYVATVN